MDNSAGRAGPPALRRPIGSRLALAVVLLLGLIVAVSYEVEHAPTAEAGLFCDGKVYFDVRLGSSPNPTARWSSYDATPGEALYVGFDMTYYPCGGIDDVYGGLDVCSEMAMSGIDGPTFYDSRKIVINAPSSGWTMGGQDHCKLTVQSQRWTVGMEYYDFSAICPCNGEALEPSQTISRFVEWRDIPPTITLTSPRPAPSGWQQSYSVNFECQDRSGSGINWAAPDGGCAGTKSITTEGFQQSMTVTSTDVVGHIASERIDNINIDRTPPTITAAVTSPASPDANGWYRGPVTVGFTCADRIGVGYIPAGIQTCPAPVVLSSSGTGQSASGTAYDKAGNAATAALEGIKINLAVPTITGAVVGPAPATGWYTTPPTVRFTCGGGGGEVASCTGDVTLTTEGANQSVSGTVTDTLGGTATTAVTGINVQTSQPTIETRKLTNDNHNGTVTVTHTCTSISGFDPGACPADEVITADTPGGYTYEQDGLLYYSKTSASHTVTDRAGVTSRESYGITVSIAPAGASYATAKGTPVPGGTANRFIGDTAIVLGAVVGTKTPRIYYNDQADAAQCVPECGSEYSEPLEVLAPSSGVRQYTIYFWTVNDSRIETPKSLTILLYPNPLQPLQVMQMTPEEGPMEGGTAVTITGRGFFGGGDHFSGRVHFGEMVCYEFRGPCGDATVVSATDTRLVVLSPAPVGPTESLAEYVNVKVILASRCLQQSSCWTGTMEPSFVYRAKEPPAPIPVSLGVGARSNTSAELTWSPTGADSYDVLYAGHGITNSVRVDAVPEASFAVEGLMPGGSYRFRIRNNYGPGVAPGAWSSLRTFSTMIGAPSGTPQGTQTGSQVRLTWNTVAGVSAFDVLYAGVTDTGSIVADTVVPNVSNPQLFLTTLQPGQYRFRVRSITAVSRSSWSELGRFNVVADVDTDGDQIGDVDEVHVYGTNPNRADTDYDGLSDFIEVFVTHTSAVLHDTDGDGLGDGTELGRHGTNPLVVDTDGDGLSDGAERLIHKTSAVRVDTDGDGIADGVEILLSPGRAVRWDYDMDGIDDGSETNRYLTDPENADTDSDGIGDREEIRDHLTNPLAGDSDADGFSDYDEIFVYGTNPNSAASLPAER